ncbi:hypothetical protein EIN_044910 [Entamoeba invadens IP1]|uniref:Uncharacterized protein n=1 Tax=Entamoeba invadens IP1 TaxID=370355 RepID=L7FNK1_ENTIV|nr:hypothetical protein EIN_044910 [Entamoeba invadens IP1]ELP91965.1 hypothetical protein EIN_044910 [Entamoeba invadens IP1]|eukprot:XP_004258736.1 hypothetical protein EIN_044910 [Entamoeba invadens IP1]
MRLSQQYVNAKFVFESIPLIEYGVIILEFYDEDNQRIIDMSKAKFRDIRILSPKCMSKTYEKLKLGNTIKKVVLQDVYFDDIEGGAIGCKITGTANKVHNLTKFVDTKKVAIFREKVVFVVCEKSVEIVVIGNCKYLKEITVNKNTKKIHVQNCPLLKRITNRRIGMKVNIINCPELDVMIQTALCDFGFNITTK